MTGGGAATPSPLGLTLVFVVAAASALALIWADRRPEPFLSDQFTHADMPAVLVMARQPVELTLAPGERPSALRVPLSIGEGADPVDVAVTVADRGAAGTRVTRVSETALARVAVPEGGRPGATLHVRLSSEAASRETAAHVLWSRDAPRRPLDVRYAGRPLADVAVLPATAPLLIVEYPWPSRWLLAVWVLPLLAAVTAWRASGSISSRAVVALALAATVSSALLWQRDYTRRAAHLDADAYAQSVEQMARFAGEPNARAEVADWFRSYPHATTQLVPALMAPFVLLGAPVGYVYMLLSALACWLSLLVVQRVATRSLGVGDGLAWGVAAAFACHPVVLRTFARPVTDGAGLLLVVCTLALLLRRLRAPGPRDELWLALLLLAHPLTRPQGFAYWPFVAVAIVWADRVREGGWPPLRETVLSGLRLFGPPLLVLAALYLQLDWWHNVGLMLEKARRFQLASTSVDFAASCAGVLLLLPLLGVLRRREGAVALRGDPRARLLAAWALFAVATLVAVRAPFWLRHFVPALPAVYWLAAMWIEDLRGRARLAAVGLLSGCAALGIGVTLWQIAHLEPLPAWLAPLLTAP